jgi:hypothetical protein
MADRREYVAEPVEKGACQPPAPQRDLVGAPLLPGVADLAREI